MSSLSMWFNLNTDRYHLGPAHQHLLSHLQHRRRITSEDSIPGHIFPRANSWVTVSSKTPPTARITSLLGHNGLLTGQRTETGYVMSVISDHIRSRMAPAPSSRCSPVNTSKKTWLGEAEERGDYSRESTSLGSHEQVRNSHSV